MKLRFNKRQQKRGGLYLTFDDGPDENNTPKILNILHVHQIHATFFIQGNRINGNQEILKRICEEGHRIGNHGYAHHHPWKANPLRTVRDLIRGKQVLEKYSSIPEIKLMRPPYGKMNIFTLLYALMSGIEIAFWSLDTKDYMAQTDEDIKKIVAVNMKDGDVLLFHDSRNNERENHRVTIQVVEWIVEKYKDMQFKVI